MADEDRRMSLLPRWLHRAYAWTLGYFWLPCPRCARPFGGHEWDTERALIPKAGGGFQGVCRACAHDLKVAADG